MPNAHPVLPLTDADLADITSSVNLLAEALREGGVNVPDALRDEIWKGCLVHHSGHLRLLKVNQVSIDPYKVITWFGYILATKINGHGSAKAVVHATILTLNYCLSSESPLGGLDQATLSYLEDFVVNELDGKHDYGIGKNGLFVAFHTASMMKRKSQRSFSKGWGGTSASAPQL